MKKYLLILPIAVLCLAGCTKQSDEDRTVEGLLRQMTLEEKIGQLNLISNWTYVTSDKISDADQAVQQIKDGKMGGVYGFADMAVIRQLQHYAVDSTRLHIPLLFGNDVIHGLTTVYPIPLGMASSWNPTLVEESARMAAREATAVGINWVFSPMVDICRDARWGRICEGAGEDPYLGGEMAKAYVRGYQGNDLSADTTVMVCVKHYALYGAAEAGRDYNSVFLSRQEAMNGYMNPYRQAALAGAGSYMSSFNEFEGIPASCNRYLLTEVLRDEWGFDGFVVSDAQAVEEVEFHGLGDEKEVSRRCIEAGLDMDMGSDAYVTHLSELVREGAVKEADIDRACRNILRAKYRLGLFSDPYRYCVDGREEKETFTEEQHAFARRIAQESQVLLKNDGTLPLRKDARIALVGPFADNAGDMNGAWSMSTRKNDAVTIRQGVSEALQGGQLRYAEGSWVMLDEEQEDAIRYGLYRAFAPFLQMPPVHPVPQQKLIADAVAAAQASDLVVACVGELNNMSGEACSRADITLPDAQQELLRALKATGKPLVVVLTTGRPLVLNEESELADALLCTWALGTEAGHAIADVLFGDVNPSGKLTVSFPRSVGQEPLYYNHKNTGRPHADDAPYRIFRSCYQDVVNGPLYCFGYGLSYTRFEYTDLALSDTVLTTDGRITASVRLKNAGDRDGQETVQLYIRDVYSSSTRPVMELRAFRKVALKAGEEQTVSFELTQDDLKYYDHELRYVCEPGEYEIMIGTDCVSASQTRLRLTAKK